jgi:hypothetical protein
LNLQPISNIAELRYDQVNSQYGSRLYILGSPELQYEQLYTGIPVSYSPIFTIERT